MEEKTNMASGGVGTSSSTGTERIIPITILSSKHHKKNDENDNKSDNNAQWDIDNLSYFMNTVGDQYHQT